MEQSDEEREFNQQINKNPDGYMSWRDRREMSKERLIRHGNKHDGKGSVTRLRRPTIGVDVQLGNKLGSDKSVS